MIIGVHTHISNYQADRFISIEDCQNKLMDTMQENGVDYSLALSLYKVNEHRPSTKKVIGAINYRDNLGRVFANAVELFKINTSKF